MAHKRIDVAIRAFNALRRPLVVVGDGPEYRRLKRLAGPTVRLTGRLSDDEVADLLRTSQALVVTAEEEFGIAAVESLASGRPGDRACAPAACWRPSTEGATGAFYDDGDDPRALAAAVAGFDLGARRPGGVCDIRTRGSASSASRNGCARSSTKPPRTAARRGMWSVPSAAYLPRDRHAVARNP